MSRLYGRVEDVFSISNYLIENYNKKYIKDNKEIMDDELMDAPKTIITYLSPKIVDYINNCDIKIYYNRYIKDTVYSGIGEEENSIFFKTKKMKEEYKIDLVYFIGDLLRRYQLDYMPNEFDIMCQYSDLLPLLMEYLYLKEIGKENIFSEKNLIDLKLNAKEYVKIYNRHENFPLLNSEESFLRNTLLFLVPLSSMDATLQLTDQIKNDKASIKDIINELVLNPNHNREEIINNRNINTYGFKRLRKEIDFRGGKHE